jgi:hypothetical protein
MQRANRWLGKMMVGAVASAVAVTLPVGCARDMTSVVAPISGTPAHRASYAGSTQYGDYYEVDGEVLPGGSGNPWDAVISNQSSEVDWSVDCSGSRCDVYFKAYMAGLWHTTNQTIHWEIGGQRGTVDKTNFAPWECSVRQGLACMLAERRDRHEVRVEGQCSWEAKVRADHAAWWGAWYDLQILSVRIGQVGRVDKSSVGTPRSFDDCAPRSGGGNTQWECYDFFLVWTDGTGYHEVYLGTQCFEQYAT